MQRVEGSTGRLPPVVQECYKDLFLSLALHVLVASSIFGGTTRSCCVLPFEFW